MSPAPARNVRAPSTPGSVRPSLGLPAGTVRALLALGVVGAIWYLLYQGREVPKELAYASFMVVAAYFGARNSGPALPPTTRVRNPLGLPAGWIRGILLFGSFIMVIAIAMKTDLRSLPAGSLSVIFVMAAFFTGWVLKLILDRPDFPVGTVFRDLKAIICLIAGAVLVLLYTSSAFDPLPEELKTMGAQVCTLLVILYFGSR